MMKIVMAAKIGIQIDLNMQNSRVFHCYFNECNVFKIPFHGKLHKDLNSLTMSVLVISISK